MSIILLSPVFIFVYAEEVNIIPHDDAEEAQVARTQETENFAEDGHTDHTHTPVSSVPWWQNQTWWILLISSIVLMSGLSFGVHKYLKD